MMLTRIYGRFEGIMEMKNDGSFEVVKEMKPMNERIMWVSEDLFSFFFVREDGHLTAHIIFYFYFLLVKGILEKTKN